MKPIRSSSHHSTNQKVFEILNQHGWQGKKILDVGAGRGHMIQRLGDLIQKNGARPQDYLLACDLFPDFFEYTPVECLQVDFLSTLPFLDNSFDIVYAIEVIEHLHSPYDFIHEIRRILRPGGLIVISSPNILNLTSRLSYLLSGFFSLFGPLSFDFSDRRRQHGHIMPFSYYYMRYALKQEGFVQEKFHVDRMKKSSLFLFIFLFAFINAASMKRKRRLFQKHPRIYQDNKEILSEMNNFKTCCSRSIILSGIKK